ncbi:MAG: hypothetical protein JWN14_2495, partial [Chthonomonadales bacterium]|nr:hypothetical protein [Chthonomonadales bacterium]
MTRSNSLFVKLMLSAATSALSLPGLCDPPSKTHVPPTTLLPTAAKQASLMRAIGRLPLSFEGNLGQTNSRVRFLTQAGDSTLFLTPSEAVFSMPVPLSTKKPAQWKDRKT